MTEITQDQLRELLRLYFRSVYGSQRKAAAALGVSDAYVSAVLLGRSSVPASWMELVGARAVLVVPECSTKIESPA